MKAGRKEERKGGRSMKKGRKEGRKEEREGGISREGRKEDM